MTTKRPLGRERDRVVVPAYALERRILTNEFSIMVQLLENAGSMVALEESLELLHAQRSFRPGYRKYIFRVLNYAALMGLFLLTGAGTRIAGVSQQNLFLVQILMAIAALDLAVFSALKRPLTDVRERKLMDRWVARCLFGIARNPAFSALKLSGVERQELARLVMDDVIDRAPDGLL